MKIKTIIKSEEGFIKSLEEVKPLLDQMGFIQTHFEEKGLAVFTEYAKQDTKVEFMCGPPEWHVEMIITTPRRSYAFKDLLQIPLVDEWFKSNKFSEDNEYNINAELRYFINLLEFALPVLRQQTGAF
jgi:hypothetical protein